VSNAFDRIASTRDLVTLGDSFAVAVFGAGSVDALVFDTSLFVSAGSVSDASNRLAFVVFADFAVISVAVAVFGTLL